MGREEKFNGGGGGVVKETHFGGILSGGELRIILPHREEEYSRIIHTRKVHRFSLVYNYVKGT